MILTVNLVHKSASALKKRVIYHIKASSGTRSYSKWPIVILFKFTILQLGLRYRWGP